MLRTVVLAACATCAMAAELVLGDCTLTQDTPGIIKSTCSIDGVIEGIDQMKRDILMIKHTLGIATPPAPPTPLAPPVRGKPPIELSRRDAASCHRLQFSPVAVRRPHVATASPTICAGLQLGLRVQCKVLTV